MAAVAAGACYDDRRYRGGVDDDDGLSCQPHQFGLTKCRAGVQVLRCAQVTQADFQWQFVVDCSLYGTVCNDGNCGGGTGYSTGTFTGSATDTGTGYTTGTGTGTGSHTCVTCGEYLVSCFNTVLFFDDCTVDPYSVCDGDSAEKLENLYACICDNAQCADECPTLCGDGGDDTDCENCINDEVNGDCGSWTQACVEDS